MAVLTFMSLRNCGHSFRLTISFDTGTEWGIFDTSISLVWQSLTAEHNRYSSEGRNPDLALAFAGVTTYSALSAVNSTGSVQSPLRNVIWRARASAIFSSCLRFLDAASRTLFMRISMSHGFIR